MYYIMNTSTSNSIIFHEDKKNDEDNIINILDNIKTEFHSIDEKDTINIYIDDDAHSTPSPDSNSNVGSNDDIKDITPEFLRSASIMRRKENMWTPQLEEQIKKFAAACDKEAKMCKNKARRHFVIGRCMQITLIILGSISIYSTAAGLADEIRNAMSFFSGFSTTVISSVYTLFGFTKKATIEFETSLGLYSLAMMINCELLKPARIRKSPFELMYFSNMSRDKLIKKIGVDNF